MSLAISNEDEQIETNISKTSDELNGSKLFSSAEQAQQEGLNNNDPDIELIKQTEARAESDQLDLFIDETKSMDESAMRTAKSDVIVLATAVSLRDLLSYQDVLNAVEREFHLHAGQEREIIMKLWLKGQTMLSILQRFRHLLQDLHVDEKDFVLGIKQTRELISYTERDLQYFRDQTVLLENQNRFLENEFQRQLDKIVQDKNEHIARLTHLIDQTCSPPPQPFQDPPKNSSSEELLRKFMRQNVDLQHEIETLRAKLEYTFTFANEKFDNSKSSVSVLQTAFEQIREAEARIKEVKFQNRSLHEENDLLKYVIEKSQQTSNINQHELLRTVEKRSLEKELERVRQELALNDERTIELEQRFEKSDETVKFHLEKFKLKCDVLRKHLAVCTERLDDLTKQKQHEDSSIEKRIPQLERELAHARERFNELIERTNTLKIELNHTRKQLHEREKREMSSSSELENERRRVHQLEVELKSLRGKYDDVCERVSAATHQLERVKIVLEETSHRCEQLEKEKSEINAQSAHLSQNLVNVTTKYKDKLHTIKSRLEQTERERHEAQMRSEQYMNEIELLKGELLHKKEMVLEKEKITQFEDLRKSNQFNEKIRILEEELERLRQSQIIDRRPEINSSMIDIEEFRLKIDEVEKRFNDEKVLRESLQVQMKILEEENIDLRDIMNQMRRRAHDRRNHDYDRNDEIQQLLARVEYNARQYMTNFNLSTLSSSSSTLVKIVPLSSSTKLS